MILKVRKGVRGEAFVCCHKCNLLGRTETMHLRERKALGQALHLVFHHNFTL